MPTSMMMPSDLQGSSRKTCESNSEPLMGKKNDFVRPEEALVTLKLREMRLDAGQKLDGRTPNAEGFVGQLVSQPAAARHKI